MDTSTMLYAQEISVLNCIQKRNTHLTKRVSQFRQPCFSLLVNSFFAKMLGQHIIHHRTVFFPL
jgi:hypothetical protein